MGGFSNAREAQVLEREAGKTDYSMVTPVYLALTESVVGETDTGSTLDEPEYTGYARKSIAGSDWRSAVVGAPSEITNINALTFAACTAGSDTITSWALCTASSAGSVIMSGTCTSTVISTTQTPASVAVDGLKMTLD